MKNLKLKIAVSLLGMLLIISACGQYLDIQSNDGLIVPRDLVSLQKLLDNSSKMNLGIGSYGEISADDYFIQQTTYDNLNEEDKRNYTWENDLDEYDNDWARGYAPVYISNLVLDQLKDIAPTSEEIGSRDQVLGSALFYRANQYLSLLWTYAKAYNPATASTDLGIVLRQSSDFNEKSTRSSIKVCYDQVIQDLKVAMELLPDHATHVMRPSKAAAYGVLARTYLSIGRYDSAYYFADKVLGINDELLDFNNPAEVKLNTNYPFARFHKETISYFQLTINSPLNNYANIQADTMLYGMYEANDLRKQAYFSVNLTPYVTVKGNYSGQPPFGFPLFGGLATDEFYLVRAECLARTGKLLEAQADLNKLLTNRYMTGTFQPYSLANQKAVIQLILQERRKELFLRGLRWSDIKRLNLEGANISIKRKIDGKEYVLKPNANRFALPLPIDIIRETGMPQNPT
ncbi:RagB/SusD family nutrient uptake outer membrane protein [Sphingobacterium faecium]|jgi:tetratricopeptide (TPR) repeat protein|uniref:RagB/SusD family nutrient uptake outer membrane protein n=1 Tax=Sphingobacterium faecium TaxID=34087 RepID=UPI00320A9316